jgi:hypothetical protein
MQILAYRKQKPKKRTFLAFNGSVFSVISVEEKLFLSSFLLGLIGGMNSALHARVSMLASPCSTLTLSAAGPRGY